MNNFEVVKRFKEDISIPERINLPKRATANAAGYDFEVAEDTVVPSFWKLMKKFELEQQRSAEMRDNNDLWSLTDIANATKALKIKPTLVPTGVKCHLESDRYLELSVRSSLPLKHWLILANGVGIIDADYYSNPDNDGEIMFQLINLSPFDIQLKAGDRIGQGIIKKYGLVEGDRYDLGAARLGGFGSTNETIFVDMDNPFYSPQLQITTPFPTYTIPSEPTETVNEIPKIAIVDTPYGEYYDGSRL